MNILIIGAGSIGSSLAEELSREDDNVVVIDTDEKLCENLNEKMDLLTIPGDATSPAVLEIAGIRKTDVVIALTSSDEVNILVCGLARHYGVSKRIARLHSNEYSIAGDERADISSLGVSHILRPDKSAVEGIIQYLETPGATDAANFHGGKILMRGFIIHPNMSIADKKIADIRKQTGAHLMLVVAIIREGRAIIPSGNDVVHAGDKILVLFPRSSIEACLELFSKSREDIKKVVISGDTNIAIELASAASRMVDNIVLVDPDPEHVSTAADHLMLKNVEVLQGDCTHVDMLHELYIDNTDYFISVSKDMENNVMASLLAKAEGASRVIALTDQIRYIKLFHSIGISHVICPRISMAQEIMEVIYRGRIWKSMRIRNVDIEAVRIIVSEGSPVIHKSIQDITKKRKHEFIIGIIIRGDNMIMPQGETIIELGDEVIVITDSKMVSSIINIFTK